VITRSIDGFGPLQVPVELANPVDAVEVGKHQDVEELGTGSGTEGVEPLPQGSFELLEVHEGGR
jgi:hypothetical protein